MPNSAEREDIKKLLQCMLDMSWAGDHGDHSTVCDMCNMTSIWFKLAHMLLETVFPEGGSLPEEEVLSNVAFGSLFRNNSSSKGVSSRSLCKSAGEFRAMKISEVCKQSVQMTKTLLYCLYQDSFI